MNKYIYISFADERIKWKLSLFKFSRFFVEKVIAFLTKTFEYDDSILF